MDIHQSGGASGHIGICHRSGSRFLYGWDRCILSDHWIHFRHQQQVKVLCRVRLSGTHSLICGLLSRVVKIPLWRWQWMMIYMLINAIGCIISSVLLNIVDHRQARQHTHTHTHFVLCLMHWQQPHFWYFSFPRAGSWTRRRKTGSRKTMTVSHWATNRTAKNHQSDLLSSEVWMVLVFFYQLFPLIPPHFWVSSDVFNYFLILKILWVNYKECVHAASPYWENTGFRLQGKTFDFWL